ncbi:carbamoyltransferase HypF [Clostridium oryzae]|uniref:Carbamoyltransferase n=1 Tax=Clostridium oryzae TaxID=1450648 RepID=A0A1V4ILS0_9CLOT|nr:carbamoyltransferase HypF [Clostridium oryzae]OPJ60981.1 carbamoyltransferase HypF [Clostridium oryzae]
MLNKINESSNAKRFLIQLYGRVQGVGFRPFIYRKAKEFKIYGSVSNSGGAVVIDFIGSIDNVKKFVMAIVKNPPDVVNIEKVQCSSMEYCTFYEFTIKESIKNRDSLRFLQPDLGICEECVKEVMDKKSKRYRYAFTNCTNCGPRYSIIKGLPYDRKNTMMDEFKMCSDCSEEYKNPYDRRFHAEPNCCARCGPKLTLLDRNGKEIDCYDAIYSAAELIKKGKIVAIKGIGGFHLVCDARNEQAIDNLRIRKRRPDKPLAVMMRNQSLIRKVCYVSERENSVLTSSKRPIVLLKIKAPKTIPKNIAPRQRRIGVMLPYTPLHYMLLESKLDIVVMTSGNISGAPIEYENSFALERLGSIADYFLINNRKIYVPIDDAVVKVFEGKEMLLRRGRGYAPYAKKLSIEKDMLALGAELKSSVCISTHGYVHTSQYLGDLKQMDCYRNYEYVTNHLIKILDVNPSICVQDMHPDYNTKLFAAEKKTEKIYIQHHHAHMVSCMAEHDLWRKVIAMVFDGTGYGKDGAVWGGEFLVGDRKMFERAGHFQYIKLQGGDRAAKEPWRCAASYLYSLKYPLHKFLKSIDKDKLNVVEAALDASINCHESSSLGRMFDAVSSLLGVVNYATYEGHGAIELENLMDETVRESYEYDICRNEDKFIIEYRHMFEQLLTDLEQKIVPEVIAAKFNNTITKASCDLAERLSEVYKIREVVLSGGVFQNEHLLASISKKLNSRGFNVTFNCLIPINDEGISFGQIVAADEIIKSGVKGDVFSSAGKN